jgi:hypothetical protein
VPIAFLSISDREVNNLFKISLFTSIQVDKQVQNKCISKGLKIWKKVFCKRIFNLQLHDFLETKMNAKKEEPKSVKGKKATLGGIEAP